MQPGIILICHRTDINESYGVARDIRDRAIKAWEESVVWRMDFPDKRVAVGIFRRYNGEVKISHPSSLSSSFFLCYVFCNLRDRVTWEFAINFISIYFTLIEFAEQIVTKAFRVYRTYVAKIAMANSALFLNRARVTYFFFFFQIITRVSQPEPATRSTRWKIRDSRGPTQIPLASNYAQSFRVIRV